jgi:toxin-antitoxin system PIN domain toxin
MTQTVDTNVLLYASNEDSPLQPRAVRLIEHLAAGPALFVLLWPTILSYLRMATHPSIFPKPLVPEEAESNVAALLARPQVRVVGEASRFWDVYRSVTAPIRARGNLVPDAHLVALMHQHGVSTVWSRDRDFRKFDGIIVRDPFGERYADTFG